MNAGTFASVLINGRTPLLGQPDDGRVIEADDLPGGIGATAHPGVSKSTSKGVTHWDCDADVVMRSPW